MKFNLYAVYDRVGEESGAPFMCKTDGLAKRQFILAFRQNNKPEIKMDDHWLWRIGTFDNETMKLVAYEPIKIDMTPEEIEVSNEHEAV